MNDVVLTNRYVYDDWNVMAVLDNNNNVLEAYVHGPDLSGSVAGGVGGILSSVQNDKVAYYHYDCNGNVIQITDNEGELLYDALYAPFGEVLMQTGAFTPRYQFSSKEYDALSELNYYGYRFYSSGKGRWINRDPIAERGGLNLYSSFGNTGIGNIDYLGLATEDCDAIRARIAELEKLVAELEKQVAVLNDRLEHLYAKIRSYVGKQKEAAEQAESWAIIAAFTNDALNGAKRTCAEGWYVAPENREKACNRIARLEKDLADAIQQHEWWSGRSSYYSDLIDSAMAQGRSIVNEIKPLALSILDHLREIDDLLAQLDDCCDKD